MQSIVGGTPAYRREFVEDDVPSAIQDFDDWALRTVLNPSSPLFREARYLLSEEPGMRDVGLYQSVLAAVAFGNSTSGGIASYVGRKTGDITHHLSILEDCGLLRRDCDAFRTNRTLFRICEPLITFYQAIMRPDWPEWEHGRDPTVVAAPAAPVPQQRRRTGVGGNLPNPGVAVRPGELLRRIRWASGERSGP